MGAEDFTIVGGISILAVVVNSTDEVGTVGAPVVTASVARVEVMSVLVEVVVTGVVTVGGDGSSVAAVDIGTTTGTNIANSVDVIESWGVVCPVEVSRVALVVVSAKGKVVTKCRGLEEGAAEVVSSGDVAGSVDCTVVS